MKAGELNRRISIFVRDNEGTEKEVWSNVAARVRDLTSKEGYEPELSNDSGDTVTIFTIRYKKDLKMDMWVRYDGDDYNIIGIVHDQNRRVYTIIRAVRYG